MHTALLATARTVALISPRVRATARLQERGGRGVLGVRRPGVASRRAAGGGERGVCRHRRLGGAGDRSLSVLAGWLRRRGSRTSRSGMVLSTACAERAVGRIEMRLRRLGSRAGGRVVVIGQSRGGELGRVLAARNPELVSTLVML